jgi:hypothetical protein
VCIYVDFRQNLPEMAKIQWYINPQMRPGLSEPIYSRMTGQPEDDQPEDDQIALGETVV